MSKAETGNNNRLYLSIVQGSLRQSVSEGTPGAVARTWEAGGERGVKHEIVYKAFSGKIVGVSFYDGESGGKKYTTLNIMLDEDENGKQPIISANISTRYAQDILKKLPSIDFEQEVRIRPYAFTPEGEDKTVTGVEITQPDKAGNFTKFSPKVDSYFHFQDAAGKWKSKNGFPAPEGDTSQFSSDDWQYYYLQVRRFLVSYVREHVCPRFEGMKQAPEQAKMPEHTEYPKADINPDDIPF